MSWHYVTIQLWLGTARDSETFWNFFAEDESRYELDDYADVPISPFAASQGEIFIDHDFTEGGVEDGDTPLGERFWKYSGGSSWGPIAEERLKGLGIGPVNSHFQIGVDDGPSNAKRWRQVKTPRDASADGVEMHFVGEISYVEWWGRAEDRPDGPPPPPRPVPPPDAEPAVETASNATAAGVIRGGSLLQRLLGRRN